ncbi:MAG: 1-acyl-sn-glycerol-3-phosphate acyltransferase [Acidimicrobiia bacterium]|nr:1-acyl-sn-glycerol-3-phosphate acyltransferase [Acidimicrobiia bacterium]
MPANPVRLGGGGGRHPARLGPEPCLHLRRAPTHTEQATILAEGLALSSVKRTFLLLRSAVTYLVAGLSTVGIALAIVIRSAFGVLRPSEERLVKRFGRVWVVASGANLEVSGLENIEEGTPYIVVANHRSNIDIMVLTAALPIPIRFLSKVEVFKFPLLGSAMRSVGMIALDREMGRRELAFIIRNARSLAAEGKSLVVFPEGTRSITGEMLPFKTGAIHIAARTGCPILPVAVQGTGAVWPPQSSLIRGGPVSVKVMPPVTLTKETSRASKATIGEIRDSLMEALAGV